MSRTNVNVEFIKKLINMYGKALFGLFCNAKFSPIIVGPNIHVESKNNTVLVVNYGALGDFIHGIPMIYYLQENGYKVEIDTKPSNKINLPRLHYNNFRGYTSYDFILNINAPKSKWFGLFFANTFDFFGEKIWRKYIRHDWKEDHWAKFYLDTVQKLYHLPNARKMIKIPTKNKYIVIHPGASDPRKSWGTYNFMRLTEELAKKHPVNVVLGPAEYNLESYFTDIPGVKITLCKGLEYLMNTLQEGKIFIGNDGGVMHAASLFDIPVIGIFTIGCATTHYPWTNKGIYYFNEKQFKAFYERGEFINSRLERKDVYQLTEAILNGTLPEEKNHFKYSKV